MKQILENLKTGAIVIFESTVYPGRVIRVRLDLFARQDIGAQCEKSRAEVRGPRAE